MIIDGRAVSADILEKVKDRMAKESSGRIAIVRAIVMQPTPATESYLRVKAARAADAGMRMEIIHVPDDASTEEVIAAVLDTSASNADAVIVQLPLPESVDSERVLNAIPLPLDADVLSKTAYENFMHGASGALLPPVVGAIKEVLERSDVSVKGKKVVVIGNGRLVGQPAQVWLEAEGAHVTVITRQSNNLSELTDADIIISGAGSPHLITPDHIKEGVVLIDAGTSESNGAIAGDADPACADKASIFTPVPGGMGPIAVACLFQNAASLFLSGHQATSNR
jgi:methylenetetrahydrofolate dehydrogenase (NADP+)/methenyltetrahydrofolate cyclohydrolase